ncbi:hypothetical protein [Niallia endozanthoxylica]|uniref:Uncharacterized protein n=1 Tax=Niallia endozanthoxylica TaxID=2036016 RepID=A0A5J5HQZ4_9BACI|nr:hypothetical protein [Niallia endozanthoxylica]KAA9022941.1 hypothetical protein F4V44_14485 [Niallia endozanthoxylica]
MNNKINIWDDFCSIHKIIEQGVPLFDEVNGIVKTFKYGKNQRNILKRSSQMDSLIIEEVEKVVSDYNQKTEKYDGLIYIMFWKEDSKVIPLYIGKSEKYGKNGGNLSQNIKNIRGNQANFCRWGNNYAYHIGDLSAVVCKEHPTNKMTKKYRKWADMLFKEFPSEVPRLKKETYFWIKAWSKDDIGVWKEFGNTSLTFLEYLLIGLASDIYPEFLLNEEGVNRK